MFCTSHADGVSTGTFVLQSDAEALAFGALNEPRRRGSSPWRSRALPCEDEAAEPGRGCRPTSPSFGQRASLDRSGWAGREGVLCSTR
jgi:hypothetical protein